MKNQQMVSRITKYIMISIERIELVTRNIQIRKIQDSKNEKKGVYEIELGKA